jgi:hypothetical protein
MKEWNGVERNVGESQLKVCTGEGKYQGEINRKCVCVMTMRMVRGEEQKGDKQKEERKKEEKENVNFFNFTSKRS